MPGEKRDVKESQDECYYQASGSTAERPAQQRMALWEIHIGHLDEALRGALRKSSEGEEDASNRASAAAAADWWHLRRGGVHGVSCVDAMKSEHLANLAEILKCRRAPQCTSSRNGLSRSCRTTTSTGGLGSLTRLLAYFWECFSSSSCSTKSKTPCAEKKLVPNLAEIH